MIKQIEEDNDRKAKDEAVYDTLLVANEMLERGFRFENISLEKSDEETV